MAYELTLCADCARHVKADAACCPFCDAPVVVASPLRPLPAGLSRSALLALSASLALADCRSGSRGDPSHDDPGSMISAYGAAPMIAASEVAWELTASATTLPMSDRRRWRLRVAATNRGTRNAEPPLFDCHFWVNGVAAPAIDRAFQFSHSREWSFLRPGATAQLEAALGAALFEQPGDYEITLRHAGVTVAAVRVRVVP